jgi:cleavage stimulation factor subunit 3
MASGAVEGNTWAQSDGDNEVEGGNENIQLSDNTQDQDLNRSASASASASAAPQASGDSAPNTDGASEDVGEYDPESVSVTPLPHVGQQVSPAPAAQTAPQPAAKKRKTAGGFLVGDSESEDDDSPAPAPAANGAVAEPAPAPHSLPHPSPHASIPAQEAQGAVSNVTPTSQANNAPGASVKEPDSGAVAPADPINNGVKPPQDAVTTLEARIKEDPRGAMDAWLDLMAELRARNNAESLRSVYERFLAVFPQSVSLPVPEAG